MTDQRSVTTYAVDMADTRISASVTTVELTAEPPRPVDLAPPRST